MTYKEAKELKDAGYPQFYVAFMLDYQKKDNHKGQHVWYDKELYYIPTLDELIKECVKIISEHNTWEVQAEEDLWFFELAPNISIQGEIGKIGKIKEWRATLDKGIDLDYIRSGENFFGKTPLEAVRKLWLALNKKK